MSLERWINEQEKQGRLEVAEFGKVLLRKYGDVPLFDQINYPMVLKKEIGRYKKDSENPERITAFWQAFWNRNTTKVNISVNVPPCPLDKGRVAGLKKFGVGIIYVPEELATQETRYLLGKIFPRMHGNSVRMIDNEVRNVDSHFGWRLFDIQFEPLVPGSNESEARTVMVARLAEAPTLNEYIVASQATKTLTGKHLDEERYFSRLLGSTFAGESIVARFAQNGELDVVPWGFQRSASRVGARFSSPAK